MKRVLFLGDRSFIAKMGKAGAIPNSKYLASFATQTKTAITLTRGQAVDLVVIDLGSIPQDEIDQLTGSPRPEDIDATAEYQEPKVDVPDGVEFYAFNPFEEHATEKLLAKLLE